MPLPAHSTDWSSRLAGIHGLLLTGGGDIDPSRYVQSNDRGLSEHIDRQRDALEWEALRYCLERRLPVLGICRGFQVINACLGGSLLQDIAVEMGSTLLHPAEETEGRPSRYHTIEVLPHTLLASVADRRGEVRVNSRHHQGLTERERAPGLRIGALAPDGIVEALEGTGEGFLLAVQCHPERPGEAPEMEAVFAALVDRARRV